ncbi:MAG: hypothetical protein SynsKO_24150 [Synoicihabitans sp.]
MDGTFSDPLAKCKIQSDGSHPDLRDAKFGISFRPLSSCFLRLFPVLAVILTGCSTLPPVSASAPQPETIAVIQDERLGEISGMASSLRKPGVLWVHNDSGDAPRLFAVGPDGETMGVLEITNATARDWEDMALVNIDGKPWILIADVGDNFSVRDDLVIYLLPEPDPAEFELRPTLRVAASSVMPFGYEDGPRDCEGVAIDPIKRKIHLISKRTEPPVLYSLPLLTQSNVEDGPYVAKRIAALEGIVPPTPTEKLIPGRLGQFRSQVTAFDISGDNRTAAVLTYGNLYLYDRTGGESWENALTQQPRRLPVKGLPQAESVCFDENGATLLVTTESNQPPLQRYRLR